MANKKDKKKAVETNTTGTAVKETVEGQAARIKQDIMTTIDAVKVRTKSLRDIDSHIAGICEDSLKALKEIAGDKNVNNIPFQLGVFANQMEDKFIELRQQVAEAIADRIRNGK
jgi:hypothetical protein